MGGRSSSNSDTTTNNIADNSNTQINDAESLVLNFEGSENNEATIIQSDQGAIAESFNFGESALDNINDVVSNSLDSVTDTTANALDFGDNALEQSFNFGNNALTFGDRALSEAQDFGRDVLSEAQELSSGALAVASNAQTNAFSKIRDIAESLQQEPAQPYVLC